jgi:structural maintenance of chromosome 2
MSALCQVLNMKPAETLGMLEEAAGTRMYEMKKEGALRTLDKKQLKVDEIEKVCLCGPTSAVPAGHCAKVL